MFEAGLSLGASELAEELREDVGVFREGYKFLVGVPPVFTRALPWPKVMQVFTARLQLGVVLAVSGDAIRRPDSSQAHLVARGAYALQRMIASVLRTAS